ncbi:hypothetical protein IV203_016584 [Nitzschia inconspicua]|uniref:Uncharacterized protein n=1 Tax=Nitzschia inconspicua TaxID=303405 RepID=A0A9K3PK36_9STRA|nr:hypothetical protein IV203_016584 [Nitzschia inconspicua]
MLPLEQKLSEGQAGPEKGRMLFWFYSTLFARQRQLAHMNHMYADDCRGPQALSSCVDVASDSGYVRIPPFSSANRRRLPDNRATLTDITTVESSAPPDSPAPAPPLSFRPDFGLIT